MQETWTTEDYQKHQRGEHVPRRPAAQALVCDCVTADTIRFTIPGTPLGKPRMTRRDKWKKRPCVLRYRAWADAARLAAGRLPHPETIASFSWTAYFPPPHSWSAKRRAEAIGKPHRGTPDRDNVDKAVLDALFPNDSAIADGVISKRWGEPARVEIEIRLAAKQTS